MSLSEKPVPIDELLGALPLNPHQDLIKVGDTDSELGCRGPCSLPGCGAAPHLLTRIVLICFQSRRVQTL